MAGSPRFKVYTYDGEYVASFKYADDAAVLIAARHGGTIRDGHDKRSTLWTEGIESQNAGDSYDHVAQVVHDRIAARHREFCISHPHYKGCEKEHTTQ
jgi:hypothetical protein